MEETLNNLRGVEGQAPQVVGEGAGATPKSPIENVINNIANSMDEIMNEYINRLNDKLEEIKNDEETKNVDDWAEFEIKQQEWAARAIKRLLRSQGFKKYSVPFQAIDGYSNGGCGFDNITNIYLIAKVKVGNFIVKFYDEIYYHWDSLGCEYYSHDGVCYETKIAISPRKTPFTYKLVKNIPWYFIRETWLPSVSELLEELAEKELKGELEAGIEELKKVLEAGSWIYDYQHVLKALNKVLMLNNKR